MTNQRDSISGYDSECFLPKEYSPGPNDVVCARGKAYWDHKGNQAYRALIAANTKSYATATNKFEKTLIVSKIVTCITRERGGIFVKKAEQPNKRKKKSSSNNASSSPCCWIQSDEIFAREKVGQSLRDSLHGQYRSSTKAKRRHRDQVNERVSGDSIHSVIRSNSGVSRRMDQLANEVVKLQKRSTPSSSSASVSDVAIVRLFSQANLDILERIKGDRSLLRKFEHAVDHATAQ